MKRMVCAVMALLLTGCAAGQVRSSTPVTDGQPAATPETAATAETAESAATPVPTTAPPQGLVPTDADVLDYDDIRLIGYERAFQPYPETDYYTMCKDGLWGLMREDFTVVLECRTPQPVTRCHLGHWSWGSDGMNWDELDAVNARLSETGDGALEVGHGGSGTLFYWDVAASAPGFCRTGEAAQAPSPVTAADYERYGVFLPVQLSVMAESEMTGGLYPQPIGSAFCYNFAGPAEADAPHLLTEEAYEAAGWFREGLGSVYKNGKTAYLNAEGRAVTDFLYDGVWAVRCATQSVLDEKTATYADEAVYARPGCGYPLRSGYAPVCRDGLWGFLNADGAEAVPCRYEYACPTPDGLALVRENGVWSLVEPAALAA